MYIFWQKHVAYLPGDGCEVPPVYLLPTTSPEGTALEVQPAFEYWWAADKWLRWLVVSSKLCLEPHLEFKSSVLGSVGGKGLAFAPGKVLVSLCCCMDDESCLEDGLMKYAPPSLVLPEAPDDDSMCDKPKVTKKGRWFFKHSKLTSIKNNYKNPKFYLNRWRTSPKNLWGLNGDMWNKNAELALGRM